MADGNYSLPGSPALPIYPDGQAAPAAEGPPSAKVADGRIHKQAVLYLHNENTDYQCADCNMFIPDKERCSIHGTGDVIKPHGSCGFFIQGPPMEGEEPHGGVTKQQSGYVESEEGFSCKRCEHYMPEGYDCEKVDPKSEGDDKKIIHPDGCCNGWEAMDDGSAERRSQQQAVNPAELGTALPPEVPQDVLA